jgi:hypothetical protein
MVCRHTATLKKMVDCLNLLSDKLCEYMYSQKFVGLSKVQFVSSNGGINDFKKGYHLRCNFVKDENDLLADFHNILNRWKSYFCQLLNVHGVNDGRQREVPHS